jgi:amino acid transporter
MLARHRFAVLAPPGSCLAVARRYSGMAEVAVADRRRAGRAAPASAAPRTAAAADDATAMGSGSVRLPGIIAQAVGAMGMTSVVAVVIPLVLVTAGSGAWLTLVLASLVILAVAWCIARLASEFATTGGAYGLASSSLGRFGGVFTGWTTMALFALFSAGTLAAFGIYATQFLSSAGIASGAIVTDALYAFGIGAALAAALTGMRRSAALMLGLELLTGVGILVLMVAVLLHHRGSPVDQAQLGLRGSSSGAVMSGFVLAVLAFVGFETATVLGREAESPRRAIPVALILTVVIAGLFWTFCAYTMYLGFEHSRLDLASSTAPLGDLARLARVGWLQTPIDAAVSLTLFGSLIALFNGLARVLFTMARDGLAPRFLRKVHPSWGTPWLAGIVIAAIWSATALVMIVFDVNPFTVVNDFGDVNGYAYMVIYATLAIGALVFLHRRGKLRGFDIAAGLVSVLVLGYVFYENASDPTSDGWIFDAVLTTFAVLVLTYFLVRARNRCAFDGVGSSAQLDTGLDADTGLHSEPRVDL